MRHKSSIKRPRSYYADVAEVYEPTDYHDAMNCIDGKEWQNTITEEFEGHNKNGTWEFVLRTQDMKLLNTVWIL